MRLLISSANIYDLTSALVGYIMATAIRRLQLREKNEDYHSSALIHVVISQKNHEWQKRIIERLLESITTAVMNKDAKDKRIQYALEENYKSFVESNEKGRNADKPLIFVTVPELERVIEEMADILGRKNYKVNVVNSKEQDNSMIDESTGELKLQMAANIFIGGNILDRGITIKNMLCFFYGRNPKNFQQDTVLQHARMYGSRPKEDMALTRFYSTQKIHDVLTRMNDLDNQLREWFVAGKDKEEPNAIFVGFDKNIKPCAPSKIRATDVLTLKKEARIFPRGFWTLDKKEITPLMAQIDQLIENAPGFKQKDGRGFFEMDAETVERILLLIEQTYVYARKYENMDRKNDILELRCALQNSLHQSNGKVYVLYKTNRDAARKRGDGAWLDAPDDGNTDTKFSREKATDAPVLMLLRQNGEKRKLDQNGIDRGWNNAPFYWPVLMVQQNASSMMYALDQSASQHTTTIKGENILQGIADEEVLKLAYKGDMVEHFGPEGCDEGDVETRGVKETTASHYIQKDKEGNWLLNENVPFDHEHDYGLYSLNNEVFPFVVRPYKYMLLTRGRNDKSDRMLLELADPSEWSYTYETRFNKEGDLLERELDGDAVLLPLESRIVDKDMNEIEVDDKDFVCQWVIGYGVKRVLRYIPAVVDEDDEDEFDEEE